MKSILKNFVFLFVILSFYGCNEDTNEPQIATQYSTIDCSSLDINRTDIQCTTISVPDNYISPTTNYTMPVARRKAVDGSENLTPIIYISGGPGQSNIPHLNNNLGIFTTYANRDLIFHEQRGTGYFEPFIEKCIFHNANEINEVLKTLENEQNITKETMTQEVYDIYLADLYKEAYDICNQNFIDKGQKTTNFSSRQVAYDIESIRQSKWLCTTCLCG